MKKPLPPIFIDFEASSLSGYSYPIEVAWGSHVDDIHSCLISPAECHDCLDWDEDSELLHGLTRRQLLDQGVSMGRVCELLDDALLGRQVYSDANGYDNFWLEKLYHAAGRKRPGFLIRHVDQLLCEHLEAMMDRRHELAVELEKMRRAARDSVPRRHRAGWDVRFLIELWNMVCRHWPAEGGGR